MKVTISGKDIRILEEAISVLVKVRALGKSLDNYDYIEPGFHARNDITKILGVFEQDAEKAKLKGALDKILDKRPIKFEV